jgi:hypothetical protein
LGGGTALALLAVAGFGSATLAQNATPQPGTGSEGRYAIVRVRIVRPEFSAEELATEVRQGFVPIVREVPGFIDYFVIANDETRSWASVGIFADKAGADESTARAIAFGQQGTHDWVEGDPIIVEGAIDAAEAAP